MVRGLFKFESSFHRGGRSQVWLSWAWVLCLLFTNMPSAHAGQPRDWMLDVQPEGTDLKLDLVLLGAQATLEHRLGIFNNQYNQLTLRASGLATLGFSEAQADVDLRILVLTLGGSVGARTTYRNHTYLPGESLSISDRLDRELDGDVNTASWAFAEARAEINLPMNDGLLLRSVNRARIEGRPDLSFDWRTGVVHDGFFLASDAMALARDRHYGAVGPMVQLLHYEQGGRYLTQVNWGLVVTTRPGLQTHDDLLFLQALVNTGIVGTDASKTYGHHYLGLGLPLTLVLAYRAVLPLQR